MFQIYTTLLYATDNLRYIIERDWSKYWPLHPNATEEEAIQDTVKQKLPKTTQYSPLWYKETSESLSLLLLSKILQMLDVFFLSLSFSTDARCYFLFLSPFLFPSFSFSFCLSLSLSFLSLFSEFLSFSFFLFLSLHMLDAILSFCF
jgi:hypothetical protein